MRPALKGRQPGARLFWACVALTGLAAGCAGAALTRLLSLVQRLAWGPGELLDAVTRADDGRRVVILLAPGWRPGRDSSYWSASPAPTASI